MDHPFFPDDEMPAAPPQDRVIAMARRNIRNVNGERNRPIIRLEVTPAPARAYVRPFPLVTNCRFELSNPKIQPGRGEWQGLNWFVEYNKYNTDTNLHIGKARIVFTGIGGRVFRIHFKYDTRHGTAAEMPMADNVVVIDEGHYSLIFPEVHYSAPARMEGGMITPTAELNISIEFIELMDRYEFKRQIWPNGTRWIRYGEDDMSVRINFDALRALNPKLDVFIGDLRGGVLSRREVEAFFDFLGAYFNQWYHGSDKFHDAILNGFKFGFTANWLIEDTADSSYDFKTRTTLPFYQKFLEEPQQQQIGFREDLMSGSCQVITMKLDPSEPHRRCQVEMMKPIKGNTGQYSFYLEETPNGTLLMLGLCLQMISRQHGRFKVTIMERGVKSVRHLSYRVFHENQRTFGMVLLVLTDEQKKLLSDGEILVTCVLHLHPALRSTFAHNYEEENDASSSFVMPGVVTGYIRCRDDKKIGVCKEYLAFHCEQLNTMFYNRLFGDCGGDEVHVDEDHDFVLDALNIIWHRNVVLRTDNYLGVLDLGRYWLCKLIIRHIEMAVLQTDLLAPSQKLELAMEFDMQVIKYVIRHSEYSSTFSIAMDDAGRAKIAIPTANEIDGGLEGRPVQLLN